MISFKIEIEQNKIVKTLVLDKKEYTNIMISNENGGMDSPISLEALIKQDYPEIIDNNYVYEALEDLDFADEDRIMEILEILSEIDLTQKRGINKTNDNL